MGLFSNTQRVSKNTRILITVSDALLKALGLTSIKSNISSKDLGDLISTKLDAIGSGVSANTFKEILSDDGNVQGTVVEGEMVLNTVYLTVNNIQAMTDNEINALSCGDVVVKVTKEGNRTMKHRYVVSYKEDEQGICLTYTDASRIETVSYDYTLEHWVYNSTDVTDLTSLMNQ